MNYILPKGLICSIAHLLFSFVEEHKPLQGLIITEAQNHQLLHQLSSLFLILQTPQNDEKWKERRVIHYKIELTFPLFEAELELIFPSSLWFQSYLLLLSCHKEKQQSRVQKILDAKESGC